MFMLLQIYNLEILSISEYLESFSFFSKEDNGIYQGILAWIPPIEIPESMDVGVGTLVYFTSIMITSNAAL